MTHNKTASAHPSSSLVLISFTSTSATDHSVSLDLSFQLTTQNNFSLQLTTASVYSSQQIQLTAHNSFSLQLRTASAYSSQLQFAAPAACEDRSLCTAHVLATVQHQLQCLNFTLRFSLSQPQDCCLDSVCAHSARQLVYAQSSFTQFAFTQ